MANSIQSLAVKIFSAVPTSIVDEHAMSVMTWLNSSKHNRQNVNTVSNHLAIRNFAQFQARLNCKALLATIYNTTFSIGCVPSQTAYCELEGHEENNFWQPNKIIK